MDLHNRFDHLSHEDPGFVSLSECDPDSGHEHDMDTYEVESPAAMDADDPSLFPFEYFVRELDNSSLPGDSDEAGPFDNRCDFALGDPGADYEGTNRCDYVTSGAEGEPHWSQIFHYLLQQCAHVRFFSTVYVLVDNRDLTAPRTDQESLAHWPTVEAWWISRLGMHGPAGELCDLIFVPISEAAGLEHVHPTWAGTFVLAALVFLFPRVHFILLDSDCVPVTLFEVADLWKEVSLLQQGLTQATASCPKGPVSVGTSESVPKASKLSHGRWQHQIIGQGVLLVTEHNAEVNAGFIVAFASAHKPAVDETRWRHISNAIGTVQEADVLTQEASRLTDRYWEYIHDFLSTRRPLEEIDSVECAAWVQTGLALTPFAGCIAKYTCDWTAAWSLIGEWTSREVFLPPAGEWPRNGHSRNLRDDFDFRRPPMLTWARACFEQGSLPSLLHLAGSALLSVLPGDRMFQAQRLVPTFTRPVILHGYGGAKHEIPRTLPRIAQEGWAPLAHAMVGYLDKLPAWCQDDLRPVLGTSCDFRIYPEPLTRREQLLLLSMWRELGYHASQASVPYERG